MDNENRKKKNKNKNKKNKQTKNAEDTLGISESVHLKHNILAASQQNSHPQSSSGEVENFSCSESEAKMEQHTIVESIDAHALTSLKEMIARVYEGNIELKREMNELKASVDHLLQERLELVTRVNDLESDIQQLKSNLALHVEVGHVATDSGGAEGTSQIGSQDEDIKIYKEETNALVEKLMAQNAQLMGKVNDLHVQIDQLKNSPQASSMLYDATDGVIKPSHQTSMFTSFDVRPAEIPTIGTPTQIYSSSTLNHTEAFPSQISSGMVNPPESGEIADVSLHQETNPPPNHVEFQPDSIVHHNSTVGSEVRLDEAPTTFDNIEIVEDTESRFGQSEDKKNFTEPVIEEKEVSFVDSPLVGAPFRLLGFMARYVSGADLVSQK